jgi:hypothetical protein
VGAEVCFGFDALPIRKESFTPQLVQHQETIVFLVFKNQDTKGRGHSSSLRVFFLGK